MLDQDDNKVCYKNNLQEARPKSMNKLSYLTSHDLALWNSEILINEVQYVKKYSFSSLIFWYRWDFGIQEYFSLNIFQEWIDSFENFPSRLKSLTK